MINFKNLSFSRKNLLGKGGVGRVYKGLYLKSDVAIKEYSNYNIFDNFQDEKTFDILLEVVNCLTLNVPRVNKCYGIAIDDKGVVYSIHQLAACSLKEKLKQNLNMKRKHAITNQLMEIMLHLSNKSIIHRDLKPENFLINKSGELEICDFGTIRKLHHDETQTTNSSFTVRYAPPEFINDDGVAGVYSDVWSIGLILYFIYYGEDLWEGIKEKDIEKHIRKKKIPKIEESEDVPPGITDIIRRAVVYKGKKRIKIEEMNEMFEKIIGL